MYNDWKYISPLIVTFAFFISFEVYEVQFVSGDEVTTLPLGGQGRTLPFGITFNPDNGNLYVTQSSINKVSYINITDFSTKSFAVGRDPKEPLFNEMDNKLYVPNYRDSSITVIDKFNNTETIAEGKVQGPFEMVVNPNNGNLYVTNNMNNTVSVINSSSYDIIENITVGERPTGIEYNKNNSYVYVTNFNNNSISIINTIDNKVIANKPTGFHPGSVKFNPFNKNIYVTNENSHNVSVFNSNYHGLIDMIKVGHAPVDIAFDTVNENIYVVNNEDNNVFKIDGITHKILEKIPVGEGPTDIIYNTFDNNLYVTNTGEEGTSSSISIIKPSKIKDISESFDTFSSALAAGDFNKDGYKDLAIGVPGEDIKINTTSNIADAGMINVIYGGPKSGLKSEGNQIWYQGKYQGNYKILDTAEENDQFGSALAAGDFNNDTYDDLAIGVSGEDVGSISDAGIVNIIYGSTSGLANTGNQIWYQGNNGIVDSAERGDLFGSALAAGDFNRNGIDDLAIGVPREDVRSIKDSGMINVIYGSNSPNGLVNTGNQIWFQNNEAGTFGLKDFPETDDQFGSALAAGDFNRNGIDDLAIGVPREDVRSIKDSGMINVIYGSNSPNGLIKTGNQIWFQNNNEGNFGLADPLEGDDLFGSALAAGDFNKDSADDLAIGVPNEDMRSIRDVGMINVIYGSPTGLLKAGNQIWQQGANGIENWIDQYNRFGSALAAGNFARDSADDLAIGVPGDNVGSILGTGAVNVIYGSNPSGLVNTEDDWWHQEFPQILDKSEPGDRFSHSDRFGTALAAGDFNKTGYDDLVIGVPGEDLETETEIQIFLKPNAGAINVIYGSERKLTEKGNQFLNQDS